MKKRETRSWREGTRGNHLTLCLPLCNLLSSADSICLLHTILLLGIAIRPVLPCVTPEQRFASWAKATEIIVYWGGAHLHNHDSDTCSYMLCIQMQTLRFKRSRNIYLFMGSGLWIFIAATPVKPIKVSGNKRDEWRMGGGLQIKPQRIIQWWCILRSTDLRPAILTSWEIWVQRGFFFKKGRKNATNSSKMTNIQWLQFRMPLPGTIGINSPFINGVGQLVNERK